MRIFLSGMLHAMIFLRPLRRETSGEIIGGFMFSFLNSHGETEESAQKMLNGHAGYYDVHIRVNGARKTYRVLAHSDYAAAVQVRRLTGVMANGQEDVEFLATPATATLGKAFDMIAA